MSSVSCFPSTLFICKYPSKNMIRIRMMNDTTTGGSDNSRRMRVTVGGKKYKGTVMREEKLAEMIEKKVAEAMEACDGDGEGGKGLISDGCRVAWDEVEEVSQAKADLRRKLAETDADPLESFCGHNPHIDECTVYQDDE